MGFLWQHASQELAVADGEMQTTPGKLRELIDHIRKTHRLVWVSAQNETSTLIPLSQYELLSP